MYLVRELSNIEIWIEIGGNSAPLNFILQNLKKLFAIPSRSIAEADL